MARNRILISGFTLVELVVIILVLGVLAATMLPRSNNDALMLSTQAAQIAADIRYAQALAMTRGQKHWIRFVGTTGYQFENAVSVPVPHPSGQASPIVLKGGVSFALTSLPNSLITFDGLGVPYTDTAAATPLAATATISMVKNTATQAVSIHLDTGMVRVCSVPLASC